MVRQFSVAGKRAYRRRKCFPKRRREDGRMNAETAASIALPQSTRREIEERQLFLADARIDGAFVVLTVAHGGREESCRLGVHETRVFESAVGAVEAHVSRLGSDDGAPVAVVKFNRAISAWYVFDKPGAFVYNEFEFGMSPVLVAGEPGESFAELCRRLDHRTSLRTLGGSPGMPGAL